MYIPRKEKTSDGKYKYHCFAVTSMKIKRDELTSIKESDRRWLEKLSIQELPVLAKVICLSENPIAGYYGNAIITKIHPINSKSVNVVGELINSPNSVSYEQFFKDHSIFIKTLDRMRLYFMGYFINKHGQARIVRFYTPKTTTDKHYFHMNIIKSIQARLPEAVYKRLKKTLNLRIENETLAFRIYRNNRVEEITADFTVPSVSVCIENFAELAEDPAGFIISCYAEMVKNAGAIST